MAKIFQVMLLGFQGKDYFWLVIETDEAAAINRVWYELNSDAQAMKLTALEIPQVPAIISYTNQPEAKENDNG